MKERPIDTNSDSESGLLAKVSQMYFAGKNIPLEKERKVPENELTDFSGIGMKEKE